MICRFLDRNKNIIHEQKIGDYYLFNNSLSDNNENSKLYYLTIMDGLTIRSLSKDLVWYNYTLVKDYTNDKYESYVNFIIQGVKSYNNGMYCSKIVMNLDTHKELLSSNKDFVNEICNINDKLGHVNRKNKKNRRNYFNVKETKLKMTKFIEFELENSYKYKDKSSNKKHEEPIIKISNNDKEIYIDSFNENIDMIVSKLLELYDTIDIRDKKGILSGFHFIDKYTISADCISFYIFNDILVGIGIDTNNMPNNIEIIDKDNKEISIEYFYNILKMIGDNKNINISDNIIISADKSILRITDKDFERLWE